MDCETASGLMPWLMNGSLAAAEAEGLRSHLASCAACRQEMEETRRAASVFDAHPAASAILDLASDRPLADAALVRRHVEGCAECAEDLALARESLQSTEAGEMTAARVARPGILRWVALPATLAAGLVIGLAWPRGSAPVAMPPADPRVARLEAEVARLQDTVADLRARAEAAIVPELNLPVFELLAATLTRGPEAAAGNEITVGPDARQIALLLVAEAPAEAPAAIEIRTTAGKPLWQADGLRPSPLGAYTLAVPAALLPDGGYVLVLKPRGARPIEYRVRVRRRA
jgi:hypothetical protein